MVAKSQWKFKRVEFAIEKKASSHLSSHLTLSKGGMGGFPMEALI